MSETKQIVVPDMGDFEDVDVAEILVAPGDRVEVEQGLISLESDKASMEVPSDVAGVVKEILVKEGDTVSAGDAVAVVEVGGQAAETTPQAALAEPAPAAQPKAEPALPTPEPAQPSPPSPPQASRPAQEQPSAYRKVHASPIVRRMAREKGIDLSRVPASGRLGRILREDLEEFAQASGAGFSLPEMPKVDFSKFGPVEEKPLGRIRRLSAASVHRSWLHVPHVTQFDEADITDLEAFRKSHAEEAKKQGFKLTPVAFLLKACAAALKAFPEVNSSLDPSGEKLILKGYCHIGVAVDTPNGLMVPVIREVDRKGVFELARELGELSARTREGKNKPADFNGACFSISSLGGIGGTAFTPIVNAPEVAILGLSRHYRKPVWIDGQFQPRLMLPLSFSYDHRVIDGAQGARFTSYLSGLLADLRRLLL